MSQPITRAVIIGRTETHWQRARYWAGAGVHSHARDEARAALSWACRDAATRDLMRPRILTFIARHGGRTTR